MSDERNKEHAVVAYAAETPAEAMVVRSLLEGAGIHSPNPELVNPLKLPAGKIGLRLVEVWVAESKAEEARRIIREYLQEGQSSEFQE